MHSTKRDNMNMDEKLLKHFSEPAWNYQVIRFLDAEVRDIIPRKGRIWALDGVASRMKEALTAVNVGFRNTSKISPQVNIINLGPALYTPYLV